MFHDTLVPFAERRIITMIIIAVLIMIITVMVTTKTV